MIDMSRIHDTLAELHKCGVRERFGEEVGRILSGADVRHYDFAIFDALADKEVPALYMLHAIVLLGIVSDVDGAFVITLEGDRRADRYGIT